MILGCEEIRTGNCGAGEIGASQGGASIHSCIATLCMTIARAESHRVGPPAAELRSNAFCRSARHWAALTIRCDCLAGSAMDGPSDRPSRRRKNFSSAVARHRGRAAECSCARDQRKAPRHPALAAMSARRAVVVMAADAAAASHRQHRRGRGRIAYRAVRRPAWDR